MLLINVRCTVRHPLCNGTIQSKSAPNSSTKYRFDSKIYHIYAFNTYIVVESYVWHNTDGGRNGTSEEIDVENNIIDPQAEEQELKGQLLRKYRGYLGSLKQEFTKKRKKGKLPKEARQQLLDWWSRHYKWPYPSVCCMY